MNERVVVNPNFKNNGEFHKSLAARGVGAKDFPNTHTEVEHLGNGKFAASIGVGHRVFFDKADGNKPKRHKLTDERPAKKYVLVQGAKCCVEVYPYYAKYFDVQHEEVRLYEERWVVQRLFKEPDDWRDVDAYNPQIAVEEYSEPAGDVVKVMVTYDTDYGTLTIEYFQRDGNALKHNVSFKNTSGSPETFRVLQRWAGIVGSKVRYHGKLKEITQEEFVLGGTFDFLDGEKLVISENQGAMFTPDDLADEERQIVLKREGSCNQCADCCNHLHHCPNYDSAEPDKCKLHIDKIAQQKRPEETWKEWNARKDERCPCCFLPWTQGQMAVMPNCGFTLTPQPLKEARLPGSKLQPVNINVHAQGLKADFIFGDWTLGQNESLEIDPDSATLDDPTVDGQIFFDSTDYTRDTTFTIIDFWYYTMKAVPKIYRGYVEWDIEGISDEATITKVEFRYHGYINPPTDNCYIYAMANQPSVQSDNNAGNQVIFDDAGDGTAYLSDDAVFPEPGTGKDVGGASGPAWDSDPKGDVESALVNDWFAFGFKTGEAIADDHGSFYSEDRTDAADPKPTLYVEYTPPVVEKKHTFRLDPKPRTRISFHPNLKLG